MDAEIRLFIFLLLLNFFCFFIIAVTVILCKGDESMAVKQKIMFECSVCGYRAVKWTGKCPGCSDWNTLVEVTIGTPPPRAVTAGETAKLTGLMDVDEREEVRFTTGLNELDRVLGGGIVRGSVMLIGGDPGIGKSTLLLQICKHIGEHRSILYISGEESARQIKLRAQRLGVETDKLFLSTETDVGRIVATIEMYKPGLVIIDSIQTVYLSEITSSPGSVTQVRESTAALMNAAKDEEVPVFIVGHVNKDGAIAGPKVLEHIVDCVLYFEGERNLNYRILRTIKNRFGSVSEIGVFEMKKDGLSEVENPSAMLLEGKPSGVSGSCVVCVMEGARAIFAEVQTLASKSSFSAPRRTATGYDYNRLLMLLAVLEKRMGYHFSALDVYLNVVGGLSLDEPAADLSIVLSVVSNYKEVPVGDRVAAMGEVGLAGEVRAVSSVTVRLGEAERLGFTTCIIPRQNLKGLSVSEYPGLEIVGVGSVYEALAAAGLV